MKQILLLTILALAFCFQAFGQENECPMIKVIPPENLIQLGNQMNFSVSLIGDLKNSKPDYKWTVSNGEILDGQGTTAILVATTKEMDGQTVIATVEIKGLPDGCENSFSESEEFESLLIGDPFYKYGKISWANEWDKMHSLRFELMNYSLQTKAYLIFSIAKDSEMNLVFSRQKKIFKFLEKYKIPQSRIQMIITKGDYYQTTIWIVPEGADLP